MLWRGEYGQPIHSPRNLQINHAQLLTCSPLLFPGLDDPTSFGCALRCRCCSSAGSTLLEAVAAEEVVVSQAGRLHEGVDDGGSNAPKAPPHQIFADYIGFRGFHWDLAGVAESADDWLLVHKSPAVSIKWPKFFYDLHQALVLIIKQCVRNTNKIYNQKEKQSYITKLPL